jgi:site-specific recombinase XerD
MTSIRLPYIQEYHDRHGKVRRYFRRPGFNRVVLPGTPGSSQFMAAYEAALSAERPPIGRRHKEGTIGELVTGFYRSAYFENLKPRSKRVYRLVLDKFAQEDGHRLVRDMPRRVAMSIIEEIGATRPGMANLTLKVMRRLFAYAIKKDLRNDNPFVGIESYRAWHPSHLDGRRDRGLRSGMALFGQISGRPISGAGLSSVVERAARAAGLPAKCVPHGLRKARMRRLAERGATTKEIASVSGHKTLKEVERYTQAADQARLARAAMAREEQNGTDECLT